MSSYLLHDGAAVQCIHYGQAQPDARNLRVRVSGQPIVMQPDLYKVSGCTHNVSGSPLPCLMAHWSTAATRITSNGRPVLLFDSQAVCPPNNTPLEIKSTQTRVKGI